MGFRFFTRHFKTPTGILNTAPLYHRGAARG